MFNTRPFCILGAIIISEVTNWLEMFPGMFTSPPSIIPETEIGGFPSVEEHFAPRDSNASSNGCIGLCIRLASPVRIVFPSESEAIAVAILIVVPEF